ncbi:MAG: GNAT family N-acetyltransferase, partial [Candidatus Thorarchaeota archaeon]
METTVTSLREADTDALALVAFQARQATERKDPELTVARFKEALDSAADDENLKVILCKSRSNRELLGWLSLHTGYSRMVFIGEWHPEIRPVDSYGLVAKALIRRAKKFTEEVGKERLEAQFNRITSRLRPLLQRFETWYKDEGFHYATEETYMEAAVNESFPRFNLPKELKFAPISEITNEDLRAPFFDSFLDSIDGLFLSLSKDQQVDAFNYWFSRDRKFINEATLSVMRDDSVVGFIVVREEDGKPYIGPVGVHPDFKGKGIGKAMLTRVMDALWKSGYKHAALEMDISNTPAR